MDNRSGEQNDRIYKLISYLLPKEAVLQCMGYGIFDRVYKRKPFQTEELRGQTFRNF